ncbi:hypothetical protein ACFL1Z_04910 [Thermodesulfobacteriota bacterium]
MNIFLKIMFILSLCCVAVTVTDMEKSIADDEKSEQTFTFTTILNEKNSQIAIWLVDSQGNFIDTVYVTRKVAKKGLGNRGGSLDAKMGGARLSVLPVWAHKRGVDYGEGNFYPTKDKPLPDTITSATPKAVEFVWTWSPEKDLKQGRYYYYIEINKSFDENEYHDYSWYRGQPSIVWKGDINLGTQTSRSEAKIIGHGHVSGADGDINTDLTTLTTSLDLIEKVGVVFNP